MPKWIKGKAGINEFEVQHIRCRCCTTDIQDGIYVLVWSLSILANFKIENFYHFFSFSNCQVCMCLRSVTFHVNNSELLRR